MAPSMAQPMCRPNPIYTLYPGILSVNYLRYLKSLICLNLWILAIIFTNEKNDRSASILTAGEWALTLMPSWSSITSSSSNFHVRRKAAPIFLLILPAYLSTYECTISAIEFTKVMIFVSSASVVSPNYWISQNPNIEIILFPVIIGSRSPPFLMFSPMILDPASPNPKARR